MAALRRAAREMWERTYHVLDLFVANVPAQRFDPERVAWADIDPVRIVLWADELQVVFATGHDADEPDDYKRWIPELLEPLLKRRHATLSSIDVDPDDSTDMTIVATITVPWRGKTVGEALRIGEEAYTLIKALDGGKLDLATTADLVRGGFAHVLIDQAEGPWLDGKRAPYQLDNDRAKLELAKDVAAFANSREGGLIVIGAATAQTVDGDVIKSVKDVDLSLVSVPQMSAVLRDRIVPQIEDLEIRRVDHGGNRGVVMIHVPPQPALRKPFLVRGATIAGKINTTYVSIPTRDGEDVRFADALSLHGLLQAGQLAIGLTSDGAGARFREAQSATAGPGGQPRRGHETSAA